MQQLQGWTWQMMFVLEIVELHSLDLKTIHLRNPLFGGNDRIIMSNVAIAREARGSGRDIDGGRGAGQYLLVTIQKAHLQPVAVIILGWRSKHQLRMNRFSTFEPYRRLFRHSRLPEIL